MSVEHRGVEWRTPTLTDLLVRLVGTWRDGYVSAYATALRIPSWEALWDWAEAGTRARVWPLNVAWSTDLVGRRHSYVDTRAGGIRDACIGILAEMRFIGLHNHGGVGFFFPTMREWMQMQKLDQIIPPGYH